MQRLVEAFQVKRWVSFASGDCINETWVHYYDPENKAQESYVDRAWVPEAKTQPFAGKVMATVFGDAEGVIKLDFLPKRSTITGVYYANLLDQLRTTIRENAELKVFCCNRTTQGPYLQSCNGCCRAKRV